jgi:hypothetical protein
MTRREFIALLGGAAGREASVSSLSPATFLKAGGCDIFAKPLS